MNAHRRKQSRHVGAASSRTPLIHQALERAASPYDSDRTPPEIESENEKNKRNARLLWTVRGERGRYVFVGFNLKPRARTLYVALSGGDRFGGEMDRLVPREHAERN